MFGPEKMITVPPRHYCIVENPVLRDEKTGQVVYDDHGQAKLRHADLVSQEAILCQFSFGIVMTVQVSLHICMYVYI